MHEHAGRVVYAGHDGRPSGRMLMEHVTLGVLEAGVELVDLDRVPTPLVYHASASHPGSFGIIVTASHLAVEWNGFKFCRGSEPIHTDAIKPLVGCPPPSPMSLQTRHDGREDAVRAYADTLARLGPFGTAPRVVLDSQNGATSGLAARLLANLGVAATVMHDQVGQPYPFGTPDPQVPAHLRPLQDEVVRTGAKVGFAFDGDGDRLGVVDESGRRVSAEEVLSLLAVDILQRHPGATFVYDVLMSPVVIDVVTANGGVAVEAPSGHAHVQLKMRDVGAVLAGEGSGHLFFADGYKGTGLGFDDAIYGAARILDLMERRGTLGRMTVDLPKVVASDEWRPHCPDELKRAIVEDCRREFESTGRIVTTVDGVKTHYGPRRWALVRAANTEPALSVRVVGTSPDEVAAILREVRAIVRTTASRRGLSL
jgi:phosphomannomutase